MAENVMTIGYAAKSRGDLWTATEANEVKEVVNNNAGILNGHKTAIETINETLGTHGERLAQNTQDINLLKASTKSVWLTQEQYDALVSAGTVAADTEYNIYEE